MASKQLEVTLMKGFSGRTEKQIASVRGLGLRKRHQTVVVDANNPCILGMVNKIRFMLDVKEL